VVAVGSHELQVERVVRLALDLHAVATLPGGLGPLRTKVVTQPGDVFEHDHGTVADHAAHLEMQRSGRPGLDGPGIDSEVLRRRLPLVPFGHVGQGHAETGCDLLVDDVGRFSVGQRVWVALRPEKIRLSKQPAGAARINQLRGTVWELGYLGNRSTYRIKTATGKVVTVFSQNERRTSEWSIDWSDEVFVSWGADAAVLLQS